MNLADIHEVNQLDVPEVRNYRREAIEGGVVIAYEVRHPGEREWTPVCLFQPTEEPEPPPKRRGDFLELMLPARK